MAAVVAVGGARVEAVQVEARVSGRPAKEAGVLAAAAVVGAARVVVSVSVRVQARAWVAVGRPVGHGASRRPVGPNPSLAAAVGGMPNLVASHVGPRPLPRAAAARRAARPGRRGVAVVEEGPCGLPAASVHLGRVLTSVLPRLVGVARVATAVVATVVVVATAATVVPTVEVGAEVMEVRVAASVGAVAAGGRRRRQRAVVAVGGVSCLPRPGHARGPSVTPNSHRTWP